MFNPGPLIIDLQGEALTAEERELLQHPVVGGVVLFARNHVDHGQTAALCADIRQVNPAVLITVDQEGGRVQRLVHGFTTLPSLAAVGKAYAHDPEAACVAAQQHAKQMARECRAVGVDLSFAPVVDVAHGLSQVIGDRAFHHTVPGIIALATAYLDGMAAAGMLGVLKHCPGHGGVAPDSHTHACEDTRSATELYQADGLPFAALAGHPGCGGMMMSHVVYSAVDPLPASLSSAWAHHFVRQHCRFSGVVFSDCLSMQAIAVRWPDPVVRLNMAWQAGCDWALLCQDRAGVVQALDHHAELTLPDTASAQRRAACLAQLRR